MAIPFIAGASTTPEASSRPETPTAERLKRQLSPSILADRRDNERRGFKSRRSGNVEDECVKNGPMRWLTFGHKHGVTESEGSRKTTG